MELKYLVLGAAVFGLGVVVHRKRKAIADALFFVANIPFLIKWLLED